MLPRWYAWLSIAVGVLFLLGATNPFLLGARGVLPTPSIFSFLLVILEAVWLLLTSALLLAKSLLQISPVARVPMQG